MMSKRRWMWLLALLVLAASSGLSWWLGARSQSPEQAAARAEPPPASWITAPVEERVLASTVVMRGDVRASSSVVVDVPSSVEGSGVVTRLPPSVGSEVAEGSLVVEVSGRPVFVLQGDVPAFRSLGPGMSGSDVRQLQLALTRLGFVPDLDGSFGRATAAAVKAFYVSAGYSETSLVPFGEVVFVPSFPARVQTAVEVLGRVGAGGSGEGDSGRSGGSALVTVAAGELTVSTAVRAGDEGLLRVGMAVELLDEVSGEIYPGVLGEIAAAPTVDASGQMSRAATVVPDAPLPGSLAGANVRVTVTTAASDGEVLVVPLAAVSASADGSTRVSVLADGEVDPVDVPVTTGVSADGFVAVEPVEAGGLQAGDRVVVGR